MDYNSIPRFVDFDSFVSFFSVDVRLSDFVCSFFRDDCQADHSPFELGHVFELWFSIQVCFIDRFLEVFLDVLVVLRLDHLLRGYGGIGSCEGYFELQSIFLPFAKVFCCCCWLLYDGTGCYSSLRI